MNSLTTLIAERWQRALPWLIAPALLGLFPAWRLALTSVPLLLALHLPLYMSHQIDEHLWPAGFRRYVNIKVFHSEDPLRPASAGAIAFVNIALVWVPITLGAIPGQFLPGFAWLGLGMVAVSLVNSLAHIALFLRTRQRNPGLVTALLLLLPFSLWTLHLAMAQKALDWHHVALLVLFALALHGVVAAIIAWPWLRQARTAGR